MASASEDIQDQRESLFIRSMECPVCKMNKLLDDPRLLSCGHTICGVCWDLANMDQSNQATKSMNCPLCSEDAPFFASRRNLQFQDLALYAKSRYEKYNALRTKVEAEKVVKAELGLDLDEKKMELETLQSEMEKLLEKSTAMERELENRKGYSVRWRGVNNFDCQDCQQRMAKEQSEESTSESIRQNTSGEIENRVRSAMSSEMERVKMVARDEIEQMKSGKKQEVKEFEKSARDEIERMKSGKDQEIAEHQKLARDEIERSKAAMKEEVERLKKLAREEIEEIEKAIKDKIEHQKKLARDEIEQNKKAAMEFSQLEAENEQNVMCARLDCAIEIERLKDNANQEISRIHSQMAQQARAIESLSSEKITRETNKITEKAEDYIDDEERRIWSEANLYLQNRKVEMQDEMEAFYEEELKSASIRDSASCHNCGRQGHWKKECPSSKVCFNCRQTGHDMKDCPNDVKCNTCGTSGHVGRDCRKGE